MFFWKKAKETAGETVPERPIKISSVEWRDGQQSLLATRIRTEDMLPILPKMESADMNVWKCGAEQLLMWPYVIWEMIPGTA